MSRRATFDPNSNNPYLRGAFLQDPSRQSSLTSFYDESVMETIQQRPEESSEDVKMAAEPVYPEGLRLAAIVASLFSSIFIVAVSQTVLAAAIPVRAPMMKHQNSEVMD